MAAARNARVILVQLEIPLRRRQCVLADVYVRHRLRPAARRVKREPAGKTERVQHRPPLRQRFHDPPVLALIQKETGLLSAHNIRRPPQPAFEKHNRSAELQLCA